MTQKPLYFSCRLAAGALLLMIAATTYAGGYWGESENQEACRDEAQALFLSRPREEVLHSWGDPLVNCEIYSPAPNWRVLRATTECGGDSCSNVAWVWNQNGQRYFLDFEHANGEILVLWDSFIVTEKLNLNQDMSFTPSLVVHEFESHPSPYLNCGSPSISPGGKFLWCRKIDSSAWRIKLSPNAFPKTQGLEKMAEYKGQKSLYVVPYAWVLPPPVEFENNGVAVIRHFTLAPNSVDMKTVTQHLEIPQK